MQIKKRTLKIELCVTTFEPSKIAGPLQPRVIRVLLGALTPVSNPNLYQNR